MPDPSAPACPCCGAVRSTDAFAVGDRNRATTEQVFRYRRCAHCRTVWLQDVPADLSAHYPRDYHAYPTGHDLEVASAGETPRLELVRAHADGGRLVEIGPSLGSFSHAARAAGYDVTALELDPGCCEHLERTVGVRAINTDDPAGALADLEPVRAVVMWHVIEHMARPAELLSVIADRLEPGGVLGIAAPNPASLQARIFGRHWVHVDAPRHLTLMPLPALRDAAAAVGLEVASATTVDPIGLQLNAMGWERSLVSRPALAPGPKRFAWTFAQLGRALRPVERRGLRGAAYTVVFRKDG